MADTAAVKVEGLKDLVRDFGKLEKSLRKELQSEIRDLANIVAVEAKERAVRQGLVKTGRLVRSIRPGVRGSVGVVRETATNKGYPYPRIYEYGKGGTRSFLKPALDAKRNDVYKGVEDMLEKLTDRNGFGRGGVL